MQELCQYLCSSAIFCVRYVCERLERNMFHVCCLCRGECVSDFHSLYDEVGWGPNLIYTPLKPLLRLIERMYYAWLERLRPPGQKPVAGLGGLNRRACRAWRRVARCCSRQGMWPVRRRLVRYFCVIFVPLHFFLVELPAQFSLRFFI